MLSVWVLINGLLSAVDSPELLERNAVIWGRLRKRKIKHAKPVAAVDALILRPDWKF